MGFISSFADGWREAQQAAEKARVTGPSTTEAPTIMALAFATSRVVPSHLSAHSVQEQHAMAAAVASNISSQAVSANLHAWQTAAALREERIATTINGVEIDGRPSLIQQCSFLAFIIKLPSSTPLMQTVTAAEEHLGLDPAGKSLVERAAACYDKVYTPDHEYLYSSKPPTMKPLVVEEAPPAPIDLTDRPPPLDLAGGGGGGGGGGTSMLVTYPERGELHSLSLCVRGPRTVVKLTSPGKRNPSQCGFDDLAQIASRMGQVGALDLRVVC